MASKPSNTGDDSLKRIPSSLKRMESWFRSDQPNAFRNPRSRVFRKAISGWDSLNNSQDSRRDMSVWVSDPPPPPDLWDTDNWHCLDRVKCHVRIELTKLDSKGGRFEGRMTCFWVFRSARLGDRTQPRLRAPGLRTQSLVTDVLESRIWRMSAKDNAGSIFWRGTTIILFSGYEIFEVHAFPFDRQVIDMRTFEFVWRTSPNSDTYEEIMKIVHISIETQSMLPEFDVFPCIVKPSDPDNPRHVSEGTGPTYVSSFQVQLRIQRKPDYYVWQIFMVTYLIMTASLLPLGLKPGDIHIGDRLALHASGLLTLVAFKYSVQTDLPVVPYTTFASNYLTLQIITLALITIEALFAYKCVTRWGIGEKTIDNTEDLFLLLSVGGWGILLLYIAHFKQPPEWSDVMEVQVKQGELRDEPDRTGMLATMRDNMPTIFQRIFSGT